MRKNLIIYICLIICIATSCKNRGEFVPVNDEITEDVSVEEISEEVSPKVDTETYEADSDKDRGEGKNDDGEDSEKSEETLGTRSDGELGDNSEKSEEETTTEAETHYDKDGRLRINYADKNELVSLTGIGEKKAEAIIKYREQYGLFKTKEDLKEVKGIKDGTLNKIKDYITIN